MAIRTRRPGQSLSGRTGRLRSAETLRLAKNDGQDFAPAQLPVSLALSGFAAASASVGGAVDPLWSSVALLCRFDRTEDDYKASWISTGTAANQVATVPAYRVGNVGQSVYVPVNATAQFNPTNFNFALDTTWTFETYVQPVTLSNNHMLLYFVTGDNAQIRVSIVGTSGAISMAVYGAGQVLKGSGTSATGAIAVNHATHVAITRSGDTYTLYCDGVQSAQFTATGVTSAAGSSVQLNLGNIALSLAAAYFTNVRVTKALRYTGAFTPTPTYASGDPSGSQVYRIQTEQMYATFAVNKNDELRGEPTISGVNAAGVNVINSYSYPWGNGNSLYMPDSATVRWDGVANLAAEPVFEVSFFSILDTLATHVLFHSSCADGSSVTIYHLITPQLSVTFKDRTGAIKLQIDADNGLGGLSTTAFHKVALTRNGAQANLYVDDTLVGSGTIPTFDASRIPGYVLLGSNDTTGKAYANLRVNLTSFVHDPLAEQSYAPETNRQPDIFQPLIGATATVIHTVELGATVDSIFSAAGTLDVVAGSTPVNLAAAVISESTATGALGIAVALAASVSAVSTASASAANAVQLGTGVPGDPYWDNVVFASHFDGTAGTTAWDDLKGHSATTYNGAVLASGGKFGNCLDASAGTLSEVTWDLGTGCNLGNGLWTVDFMYNLAAPVASKWLWELGRSGGDGIGMYSDAGNNVFVLRQGISLIGVTGSSIADGSWHHLAIQHAGGGVYEFYVDGVKSAYTTGGTVYYFNLPDNVTLAIGGNMTRSAAGSQAKFDEFRVTKGVARYSGNFTSPSTAFLGAPSYVSAISAATADLSAVAGGGSNVTMDAAVAAVATATGDLTNTIPLASSASASASVFGALAQAVPLAATVAAQAGSSGALAVAKPLAGAAVASSSVIAAINSTVNLLAGSAAVSNIGSASLALSVPLVASTTAQATASGTMVDGIALASSVASTSTATGAVSHTVPLADAVSAASTATAALAVTAPLAASVNGVAAALGAINSNINLLAGSASVANVVSADLQLAVPLAASAAAVGTASASLGQIVELSTGSVGDPHWGSVVFASHFDTNLDDLKGHTVDLTGTPPTISTSTYRFGGGSAQFANSWLGVSSTDLSNFDGDFTVEFYMRADSFPQDYPGIFNIGTYANGLFVRGRDNGVSLEFFYNGGMIGVVLDAPGYVNAWPHIAYVRSGETHTVYVDGVNKGSIVWGSASFGGSMIVGTSAHSPSYAFHGFIDDLRVTKGVARYTSNFAVEPAPFLTNENIAVGSISSATGSLSGAVNLDGAAASSSVCSASLALDVPLAGSAVAAASANASLAALVELSTGNVGAVSTATGTLTVAATAVTLASAASADATATAALTDTIPLAATVSASATSTATLATVSGLGASVSAIATATAGLSITKPLAGAVSAVATATGALTDTVNLAASAIAISTTVAAINSNVVLLASVASVSNVGSATLVDTIPLAATSTAVATPTAALTDTVLLTASVAAVATPTATLTSARALESSVGAVSTSSAAINIVATLAASVQATATTTAALGAMALTLGATATATSTTSADLVPTVNMGAGVAAGSTTAGAVANATALASTVIAQAQSSSWLALNLQLTAVAQAVASVIGDVYATTPASWLTGVRRVYLHSEAYTVAQTVEVRGVLVPLDFTYVMVPPDDHAVYIASEKTTA